MTDRTETTNGDSSLKTTRSMRNLLDNGYVAITTAGLAAGLAAIVVLPSFDAIIAALLVYCIFATFLLILARRAGVLQLFGGANFITSVRAAFACVLVGALIAAPATVGSWGLPCLVAVALILDGLDGYVARRLGTTSSFGHHFDREVDAALVLILTVLLWLSGKIGIWIFAAGLMRYLLLGAGLIWPAMAQHLPESRLRSVVCGVLIGALLLCLTPIVDGVLAIAVAGAALSALTLSFAKDLIWLLRNATGKEVK